MNGRERQREILRLAEENGYVKVDYLARRLHISESSIRRDLLSLEANGEIRRTYGGAEPTRGGSRLIPYDLRARQNEGQKRTVANLAASLVSDGDVVFLDGSTTAYYLVDHLSRLHGVTVVTNGLAAALALSGTQVRLLSTGGRPNPENPSALVGPYAERLISEMH
ncbi:MAG: DeoR/GlpR transcriptional regulator, partial [Clostridia bacterium]|nr:DeoR/GlpR transcriptional regulator [Clostridia bacterium]